MLSDEEKEIFNNLKEYMQDRINNGYHKFIYNDLDWDFKYIDGINAIDNVLNLIEKQQKEIEHQKLKRENQGLQLAILNAKQVEFNKLVNTVNSYKGQFKKQQKEIEELKNEVMEKELIIDGMKEDRRIVVEEIQEQYYVSKDKIKDILGIEEDIDNEKLLSLLQTIVDENVRLEDIEDRKVQIEYNNVFNKGVKSVEDKIKALIKELEKLNEEATGNGFGFAIHYLKSLLKEE